MPVEFTCKRCGQFYRAPDSMVGKSTRCRKCGETIRVDANGVKRVGAQQRPAVAPKAAPSHAPAAHKPATRTAPQQRPAHETRDNHLEDISAFEVKATPSAARQSADAIEDISGLEVVEEDAPLKFAPAEDENAPLKIWRDDDPPEEPKAQPATVHKPAGSDPRQQVKGGGAAVPAKARVTPPPPAPKEEEPLDIAGYDDVDGNAGLDALADLATGQPVYQPPVVVAAPSRQRSGPGVGEAVSQVLGGGIIGLANALKQRPLLGTLLVLFGVWLLGMLIPVTRHMTFMAGIVVSAPIAIVCWFGFWFRVLPLQLFLAGMGVGAISGAATAAVHPAVGGAISLCWTLFILMYILGNFGEVVERVKGWFVVGIASVGFFGVNFAVYYYAETTGLGLGGFGGSQTVVQAPSESRSYELIHASQQLPEPMLLAQGNRPYRVFKTSVVDPGSTESFEVAVYVPGAAAGSPRSRALVAMAPGGSSGITGEAEAPDEQTEVVPWLIRNRAVVTFTLPGDAERNRNQETAVKHFIASQGGLVPGRLAIELALKVPEIDPERVYTAGHSSAGSVAFLLAAYDPHVKGVMAFAPLTDLLRVRRDVCTSLPDGALKDLISDFCEKYSPQGFASRLADKSVFIWHTMNDSVVPYAETVAMKAKLPRASTAAVAAGDHAQAYLDQGMGAAMNWLNGRMPAEPPVATATSTEPRGGWGVETPGTPDPAKTTPAPERTTVPGTDPTRTNPRTLPPVEQPLPLPRLPDVAPPVATTPGRPTPAVEDPGTPAPATFPDVAPPVATVTPPVATVTPPSAKPLPGRPVPAVPAPAPGVVPPQIKFLRLGVGVKLDSNDTIEMLDLRQTNDLAAAQALVAEISDVPLLRLSAAQLTREMLAILKQMKHIGRLDLEGTEATDAHMELIGGLGNVSELVISRNPITAKGIRSLAQMGALTKLYARATKLDDSACQHLAKIPALKFADIGDTRITSGGVTQLKPMKSLTMLILTHTDVSDAAIQELRVALPRLNVIPP